MPSKLSLNKWSCTFTTLAAPVDTSSTSSADASTSGVKWSTLAAGLHPRLCHKRTMIQTSFSTFDFEAKNISTSR